MALEFSTNPSVEEIPGTILPGGVDHRQARLETRRRGGGAAPGTKSLLGLEDIVKRKTFFETFCNMSLPNVDSNSLDPILDVWLCLVFSFALLDLFGSNGLFDPLDPTRSPRLTLGNAGPAFSETTARFGRTS